MPNHCSNRVSFYGDSESEIQKLHDIFSKGLENDDNVDTGSVFGHFIPEPDWANIPLSEEDQDLIVNDNLGVWEADDEDDLVEEITANAGWCILSLDYEIQLK